MEGERLQSCLILQQTQQTQVLKNDEVWNQRHKIAAFTRSLIAFFQCCHTQSGCCSPVYQPDHNVSRTLTGGCIFLFIRLGTTKNVKRSRS